MTGQRVAAIILAAGASRRMGARNKLLAPVDGRPMVATTARNALASRAAPVIVVTGHDAAEIGGALGGLDVRLVHAPDHERGMAHSLRAGIMALPVRVTGALIMLGDMPLVCPEVLDQLIASFAPDQSRSICIPVHNGARGNPLLWGRAHFAELAALTGDRGARSLLGSHGPQITEVCVATSAIFTDFDTPEALAALAVSAGRPDRR